MRRALLFLILFSSYYCSAQNYRCLQPGVKPFYTNANGYLRGMRIDSVRTSGSDTIFYPYHTPRGDYANWTTPLDQNGGSWLGKYATRDTNGVFYFGNMYGIVVIKTQAVLGDTWAFYSDSSDTSYKATVTLVDTMTVLGVVDSVKEINIEVDTNGVLDAADPINNFEIILSKNHGFVQIFDLYTFPYRMTHVFGSFTSYDYYVDLLLGDLLTLGGDGGPTGGYNFVTTSNSIFHIVPFHDPTLKEVYNFSIGDVLEYENVQTIHNGYSGVTTTIYNLAIDTILSKTTTPSTVSYTMIVVNTSESINSLTWSPSYGYSSGISTSNYDTTELIDTTLMPEEWNNDYFYHFFPKANYDSVSMCPDTVCIVDLNNINYPSGIVAFEDLDLLSSFGFDYIGNTTDAYGIGFGMSSSSYNDYAGYSDFNGPLESTSSGYLYVHNNGNICGYYSTPLAITQLNAPTGMVYIFPNPTHDVLNIDASGIINEITIINLLGQTVYDQPASSDKVQINVSNLPAGVYVVKVNGSVVQKFIKQ